MNTTTNEVRRDTEGAMGDRRSFLVGAGVSILAASALSGPAEAKAGGEVVSSDVYAVGLVSNRDLPGLSGQVLLNVYLAVANGTGFATISDPVHPQLNSHVEIGDTGRHGNEFQFDGEVILSNDPGRVGQQVLIVATVHGDFTRLVLDLGGATFSGLGFQADADQGGRSGR
jgi:hypothetical protein